jgi:hypothetical protein
VIVFGCGIEASSTEAKGTVLLKGECLSCCTPSLSY